MLGPSTLRQRNLKTKVSLKSRAYHDYIVFSMFVFEKLLFRDGLVWTVGLTVEIKLRFQVFTVVL